MQEKCGLRTLLCKVRAASMQVSRGTEHHYPLKKAAAWKHWLRMCGYKVHQQVHGDAIPPESRQTRMWTGSLCGLLQHGSSRWFKTTAIESAKGLTRFILVRKLEPPSKHHGAAVQLRVHFSTVMYHLLTMETLGGASHTKATNHWLRNTANTVRWRLQNHCWWKFFPVSSGCCFPPEMRLVHIICFWEEALALKCQQLKGD